MDAKITCDDAVRALKRIGRSSTASLIACELKTSSRAVATALREAVNDGRVSIRYGAARSYTGAKLQVALYRFKRLKALAERVEVGRE
jgi:hypothetical protein